MAKKKGFDVSASFSSLWNRTVLYNRPRKKQKGVSREEEKAYKGLDCRY